MFQIYTLSDPRTEEVRYVGITKLELRKRLTRHVSLARRRPGYHVSSWIHQLLERKLRPVITLIETTDNPERERYWIQHYRSLGARLTNLSEGCEGQIGMERSEETCQKIRQAGEKRYLDRRGQKFGLLSPVEIVGHSPVRWRCLCDCGQEVTVLSVSLGAGKTKSCGCWSRQQAAARTRSRAVHGQWQTSEYRTWVEMKAKCYNTTHLRYPKFGAQGIGVCERWRESFPNFLADMDNDQRNMC